MPLTDMCQQFLNCTYKPIVHTSKSTKAVRYENQLAYIEAINLQVKFRVEFQKCTSNGDLKNWLYFSLKALYHEPYVRRDIIVFKASQIRWWKSKFEEKLKTGVHANKMSAENAGLFAKLVDHAKFLEENIHLLPPEQSPTLLQKKKEVKKKHSEHQRSPSEHALKNKKSDIKKEKTKKRVPVGTAETLDEKSLQLMKKRKSAAKGVRKPAEALTHTKKKREAESITAKKNMLKAKKQKTKELGGKNILKKIDSLHTGKKTEKEMKVSVPQNSRKPGKRKTTFGQVLSLAESCLNRLRRFASEAKKFDEGGVCKEEIKRVIGEMRGVLDEL